MWALLGPWLLSMTGSIVARVLTSLGMGFATYTVLSTLTSTVIDKVNQAYGGLDSVVLSMMNLSGFTSSIGIIASAMVTRASLLAIKRLKFS